MAKTKKDVNKTQLIMDALAQDPNAMPKAIAESITATGVEVTPGYVSTVKSDMKKKKKRGKRTAKASQANTNGKQSSAQDLISMSGLFEARKFADRVGSIDKARQVLDALAKLNP